MHGSPVDPLTALREAVGLRYRVDREIGRGGMARVYLAEESAGGRLVAIKVLRPELAVWVGRDRFAREIEFLTSLSHPNILPILSSSGEGAGLLYYTMPFVAGDSLEQLLVREGPLAVGRALDIARDAAAALDYAHAHGVVHRDIKPGNLLLEGEKTLVCDFGIARAIDRAALEPISSSGLIIGTVAYMSPEQSVSSGRITPRSDIYSLGCVVYEMLTGEHPFTGPNAQSVVAQHLGAAPRPIRTLRPDVPVQTERAVFDALAKEPDARPRSGAELMRRLGGVA
jgi:serine/threonine protein kinase